MDAPFTTRFFSSKFALKNKKNRVGENMKSFENIPLKRSNGERERVRVKAEYRTKMRTHDNLIN